MSTHRVTLLLESQGFCWLYTTNSLACVGSLLNFLLPHNLTRPTHIPSIFRRVLYVEEVREPPTNDLLFVQDQGDAQRRCFADHA